LIDVHNSAAYSYLPTGELRAKTHSYGFDQYFKITATVNTQDMYIGGLHVMINCFHPKLVGDAIKEVYAGEILTINLKGLSTEHCGKVRVSPSQDWIVITDTTITIAPKIDNIGGSYSLTVTTEYSIPATEYVFSMLTNNFEHCSPEFMIKDRSLCMMASSIIQ
jgi:hypothetical protein